ncbi:MAG TPA: ATP-binding protein [Anaerolineae bacterium]|nr:ATP-binding protein [Anaerolineae bacterium]
MAQFVDRQEELDELNALLTSAERGRSEFVIIYGRRRIGKTTLILNWSEQSGRSYLYWVARRETPEATRHSLARALWRWAYPHTPDPQPPRFDSWEPLLEQLARMVGDQPVIIIFDEFSYAAESDPSLPSHLQAAWDHLLKEKPVILVLAGSHIGMMVDMLGYHAPLYGRFTGQLALTPLPFAAITEFFPTYSAEERVATYAVLGGVAGYWERFDAEQSLVDNIRRHLFRRMGFFRSEPRVLISDLIRETRNYEAALRATANGDHTPAEIARTTGVSSPNLSPYLKRLVELGFVERRLPATIPFPQRHATTRSRYHLSDPYLRFYFRFIDPHLDFIEQKQANLLWERIKEQFRAFIGQTTWEELCREWVMLQASQGNLPLAVERVGSHWSAGAQVDVVAINWRDKAILLGECKWGVKDVNRATIRELVAKAAKTVPGDEWQVHYAYFARSGFTGAARAEAQKLGAILVDLERLDKDLRLALTA